MKQQLPIIKQQLKKANKILLLTHVDPDGDALGSTMALAEVIKLINPAAKIYKLISKNFKPTVVKFIKKYDFKNSIDLKRYKPDLVISLDTSTRSRLPLDISVDINIDHHADNEQYGHINLVDGQAAAVGTIIYRICQAFKIKLSKKMAEGLYLSLYTDTGHFSFANTTDDVFEIADACLQAGVVPHQIYRELCEQVTMRDLQELGQAFVQTRTFFKGKLIIGFINKRSQLDNRVLIDYLRQVNSVEVAVVLVDKGDYVKVSLRSKNKIDVSKIARHFDGGGHKMAAAGKIDVKSLKLATKKIQDYFKKHVF